MKKLFLAILLFLIVILGLRINTITNSISYDVNIRRSPSPESELVGVFSKGESYEVLDTNKGWTSILVDGELSYTYREDLSIESLSVSPVGLSFPVSLSYAQSPDILLSKNIVLLGYGIDKKYLQVLLLAIAVLVLLRAKRGTVRSLHNNTEEFQRIDVSVQEVALQRTSKKRRKPAQTRKKKTVRKIDYRALAKEKGDKFESYIVEKFSQNYYTLLDWTPDKTTLNGIFPESNKNPDLKFREEESGRVFYVECKYRKSDDVKIADYQLKRYRAFGANEQERVFIVIGTGGTPISPDALYLIPSYATKGVDDINTIKDKYRKANVEKGLFFDPKRGTLR